MVAYPEMRAKRYRWDEESPVLLLPAYMAQKYSSVGHFEDLEQEELKFVHVPRLGTRLFGRADPPNTHSDVLGERLIVVQAHHLRIRLGLVFVSLNGYGDENVSYTIKLAKTCMSNMFY
ncbi:unnamed protein product [Bursaphelenchus xylophilus]|uniref:(pine wood nematode) hypothetical protein n=1 Tax=Bursaphelenchus xylophilus TaxID=6326 RepID=A0A7I8X4L5_BURXY|nr:unnamed protein product [Bursaphelenchus xylophilus]CAG9122154.1 unnamed protein product [Bursaphelenchus xylophilus]